MSLDSTWISAKISFLRPFTCEQEAERTEQKGNKTKKEIWGNWFIDQFSHHKCCIAGQSLWCWITGKERATESKRHTGRLTSLWGNSALDQFVFLNKFILREQVGRGFMGIWTSAFLCAFWRLTWLPLVCMARLIWIHTHHVSCTSESSLSPSWLGRSLRVWGGGSRVAAGCFVCYWVSGYPPCTALLLPGHVSHRLSLLFTFLMRGAVLCDMWLTAMQTPPPNYPSLGFLAEMCFDREGGALCLVVSFCSLSSLAQCCSERILGVMAYTHSCLTVITNRMVTQLFSLGLLVSWTAPSYKMESSHAHNSFISY